MSGSILIDDTEEEIWIQKYEDELAKSLFKYFMKCIIKDEIQEQFTTLDTKVSITLNKKFRIENQKLESSKFKIDYLYKAIKLMQNSQEDFKIYNLVKFVHLFIESLLKMKKELNFLVKDFDQKDFQKYKSAIKGCVCDSKCPCCDRMCGESDDSHTVHKCVYGHQIRALGGVRLSNDEAAVAFCEDLSDTYQISFNGVKRTWGQFKEERRNNVNSWDLASDCLNRSEYSNKNRERIKLVWNYIGEVLCRQKYQGMKFVIYNEINREMQQDSNEIIHYCFVIDSSGISNLPLI